MIVKIGSITYIIYIITCSNIIDTLVTYIYMQFPSGKGQFYFTSQMLLFQCVMFCHKNQNDVQNK